MAAWVLARRLVVDWRRKRGSEREGHREKVERGRWLEWRLVGELEQRDESDERVSEGARGRRDETARDGEESEAWEGSGSREGVRREGDERE